MPLYFVCLMGMGIVFVGLICIILICMAASAIIRAMESGSKTEAISQYAGAAAAPAAPASELTPEKRREMIAAVSAALAEELGKDVSAIKITSFKKI